MKNLIYSDLLNLYGKMLTDKQYSAMDSYYNLDLSLFEIADSQNISRQAVRGNLLKAQKTLDLLEQNIGFLQHLNNAQRTTHNAQL